MSDTAVPPVAPPSTGRGRSIAAAICIVLAAVLTIPSAIAYWGQRTLNDGQRYIETVGPLVNDPQVQAAIVTKVTDAIEQQVDVEALLNEALGPVITDRPRLELLIGPIAGAVNGLIERQVEDFVASDAFEDLWIAANTRAQQALMRVLEGDTSGAVSVQGDEIVLDVSEVIDQVKQQLVARGLTVLDRVNLPDKDRQIVLLESPELKQLRNIYAFANPIAKWLIVLVALLYLAAYVLSRRRPRMAVIIGAVLGFNSLLVAWALSTGQQLFVNQLSGTVFGAASKAFYNQLLSYLERGQDVLLWLGLILLVAGWFAGRNSTGTATRTAISGGLESVGEALPTTAVAEPGRWVAANALWLRVVALVVGVVVLLWANDVSQERLFWSLVVVLVLLAVIQVLVGAGRTPSADAGGDTDTDRKPDPPTPKPKSRPKKQAPSALPDAG